MQVVVVGGGIIGLASAYYLDKRGVDVIVCERRSLGAGSTERAAGGIRAQFSSIVNIELSRLSIDIWERFEREFGVDIAYRRNGYLFLAREHTTAEQFADNVELQQRLGVSSELLTPDEAQEHCRGLKEDRFVAATYCQTDGFADPHLALEGFKQALVEQDTTINTHTEVTDVIVDNGSVDRVKTSEGVIEADFVINATGPWAAKLAAMADIELPVTPRRRRLGIIEPANPVPESDPLTIDFDTGFYFRPERDGSAIAGGHFGDDDPMENPESFDATIELDWSLDLLEHGLEVVDYFGLDAAVRNGWAGLYAVTPDHHPIIEETIPGFVNAVGFSGHGFMHSPATGMLVAELVVDGAASTVDIEALRSERFEQDELIVEANVI